MHFATEFWLTRLCFQHALGGIYLIAFLIAANQFIPLLGARGCNRCGFSCATFRFAGHRVCFTSTVRTSSSLQRFGAVLGYRFLPSAVSRNRSVRRVDAHVGVALDHLPLTGECGTDVLRIRLGNNAAETGFLAIFLGSSDTRPPVIVMWLIVWVLFRTMFGAGMIKVRADPCWRDLTCLFYHYETQPLPNPLSWYLHHAPRWFHKAGVLFNHFTELIVPWFYFMPAPLCYWAGAITIVFQITLILSGNLSWLNYITIVLCIPCFDDRFLSRLLSIPHSVPDHLSVPHTIAVGFVTNCAGAQLATGAEFVLASTTHERQFRALHLVNTYGAFGAVTRERLEVVIKGTDAEFADASAQWREYEFKGKPGDVNRPPASSRRIIGSSTGKCGSPHVAS
jgi:Protein of unknown function (DUF1222).